MAEEKTRRDFIFIATGAVAAMGLAAISWPVVASMNPAHDALAGLDVDLADIKEGQQVKILWMGMPIFIRHRTRAEILAAQSLDISDLIHPETDQERLQPLPDGTYNPSYLVMIGVCTHFGCIPVGEAGDFDGWFCPCHGAHFDTSGRVHKGPPPINMRIPPYHYVSETVITLERF